jgi:glucose/arabinose dehydrogenase
MYAISALLLLPVVTLGYAVNDGEDYTPQLTNSTLKAELITSDLAAPTSIAFLGPNDILITEKNKGTVQRIVNGEILKEPLLDVNVANEAERGMLGIAVSKNSTNHKTYVFLYYTESSDVQDGTDDCERLNYCPIGEPVGNRLYRYELIDDRLVNPYLLLNLPASPGADHNGGGLLIGPDDNVYVMSGDGDSCAARSCQRGIEHSVLKSQSSNVEKGMFPTGRAGVLRVTQDGQIVNGKGILGDEHPLDMYYAYGIRNGFGMDFDPLTGRLWDVENGPGYGDEINLVEPGFNSGYIRAQGPWQLTDYNMLNSANAPFEQNEELYKEIVSNRISEDSRSFFNFNGKGKYSNPELTWYQTVAPTSLIFFHSTKLGHQYENDIFVGDIKYGNIYNFNIDKHRTALLLKDKLADKVVDSMGELDTILFGEGFGAISDLEIGPDGNLYIVSFGKGSVYKIVQR